MPQVELARAFGRHPTAIEDHLKSFECLFQYLEHVDVYRDNKQRFLDAAEALALKSLVDSLSKDEGNLQQRAYAFREIFAANRLTHNQSTSNRAVISFTDIPQQLQDLISLPQSSKPPDK